MKISRGRQKHSNIYVSRRKHRFCHQLCVFYPAPRHTIQSSQVQSKQIYPSSCPEEISSQSSCKDVVFSSPQRSELGLCKYFRFTSLRCPFYTTVSGCILLSRDVSNSNSEWDLVGYFISLLKFISVFT